MKFFPIILADEDYGKLIGFVVIAVIWGIGALASMVSKAAKKMNTSGAPRPTPMAAPPPIPRTQSFQPARPVGSIKQRNSAPARRPSPSPIAAAQQRAPALPQAAARPAPAPAVRRQPVPAAAPEPSPITLPAVVRPIAVSANAAAIRRWLRPESLRKQFILTELLQPPMAMRPPRE